MKKLNQEEPDHDLLRVISLVLMPFLILFGIYIVLNGDLSPGGGFQGGVVLATSYILIYFISEDKIVNLETLIRFEKYLFFALIVVGLVHLLFFTQLIDSAQSQTGVLYKRWTLVGLNALIGAKVALGMSGIITMFFEEGSL